METTSSYTERRSQLEEYFDRTASDAWAKLTSTDRVSRIRATVRAGRDSMRSTILSWLPDDLDGRRVLDAGCGTGALATELAARGAEVVAIDLSPNLIKLANERWQASNPEKGSIEFAVGDMLDPRWGDFDHVVAMDSLIHYQLGDLSTMVGRLCDRASQSVIITFAPRTFLLSLMHAVGRFFPRSDRAPAIEPVSQDRLSRRLQAEAQVEEGGRLGRTHRVHSAFYISQALEWQCS